MRGEGQRSAVLQLAGRDSVVSSDEPFTYQMKGGERGGGRK